MTNHDYPTDTFTETDVIKCLEAEGKKFKNGSRYILSQCPTHEDANPSVQIYKDDWFVNCHAGCGRYHITKAYPELRRSQQRSDIQLRSRPVHGSRSSVDLQGNKKVSEHTYKTFDLMEDWKKMAMIPRDHNFKNLPLEVLDDLGWRYDATRNAYFIPYFSRSKTTIPFGQWRNLGDGPRFNFLKDAKPTCYGTWNLTPGDVLFVVEGASDCAVLQHCFVPWIGLPSASSGELMKAMATFARDNGIGLVYAGDNDDAGNKLREALHEVMSYRVKQPPKKYKDWGDFYFVEGEDVVREYCFEELDPKLEAPAPIVREPISVEDVQAVWPDAKVVDDNEAGEARSKEQPAAPTALF